MSDTWRTSGVGPQLRCASAAVEADHAAAAVVVLGSIRVRPRGRLARPAVTAADFHRRHVGRPASGSNIWWRSRLIAAVRPLPRSRARPEQTDGQTAV